MEIYVCHRAFAAPHTLQRFSVRVHFSANKGCYSTSIIFFGFNKFDTASTDNKRIQIDVLSFNSRAEKNQPKNEKSVEEILSHWQKEKRGERNDWMYMRLLAQYLCQQSSINRHLWDGEKSSSDRRKWQSCADTLANKHLVHFMPTNLLNIILMRKQNKCNQSEWNKWLLWFSKYKEL